ncbi:MAG: fumarylacetoacetate hydrolase family protein [Firmicutes bacterium]|nr:fumarylacetoacetate hydrolase family protein [Bacillota bacterium]
MKLVTFEDDRSARVGLLSGERVVDLSAVHERGGLGGDVSPDVWQDMLALIESGPEALARIRRLERDELLGGGHLRPGEALPVESVRLLAPIPRPRKNVFCIGLNYADHVREGERITGPLSELPRHLTIFTKPPTAVVGPGDILAHRGVTDALDYEVELGVVIGRRGINIPEEDALDYVFGYTIINDISARDLQSRHGQWFKGKSLDTSCPVGPCIVPAADIGDVQNLAIELRLNGRTMQRANTGQMIFPVAAIISQLSLGMTLEPGDLIATGTPAGVGFARQPPVFLRPGDVVEAEIEGIGVLRNRVADSP